MKVTLLDVTPDGYSLIASMAELCYGKESKKTPEEMVRMLYSLGHHSVFEHVKFSFLIEGISRVASHQLVRYRHASFTQESQRYSENKFRVVSPIPKDNPEAENVFQQTMKAIEEAYQKLVDLGVHREDARYVLPGAFQTNLGITLNLRELMHICNQRTCLKAQSETRDIAKALAKEAPEEYRWMLVPTCKTGLYHCNRCANEKK